MPLIPQVARMATRVPRVGDGVAVPAWPIKNELSVRANEIVLSVKGSSRRGDGRATVAEGKRKGNAAKKKHPAARWFRAGEVLLRAFCGTAGDGNKVTVVRITLALGGLKRSPASTSDETCPEVTNALP